MGVDHWLQKTSHAEPPEGELFLLTTPTELQNANLTSLPSVSNVVYTSFDWPEYLGNGEYVVMEYASYEDMRAAVEQARQLGLSDAA